MRKFEDEEEGYDYGLEPEDPMLAAVRRARQGAAATPELDAQGGVIKYDPAKQPLPDDDLPPAQAQPKFDFSDDEEALELTTFPTGDAMGDVLPPKTATPAEGANAEYLDALKKIRERLSRPGADYAKGFDEAQAKDESANRTERIMQLLSAGMRKAPAGPFTPVSANVSGFMQRQNLARQGEQGELSRLGALARMAKPTPAPVVKGPPQMTPFQQATVDQRKSESERERVETEALRAYAYKHLPMLKPGDLDGVPRSGIENALREAHALERAKIHAAAVARGQGIKEGDKVAAEARELAGKLGDPAVFEQRYARLQELAKANGGQLPGLGVIEGVRQQPGIIGSAARLVSPPTPEAVEGRKLLKQLAADYAREISGAGVSDRERATLNSATVDVDNDDSAIALAGLKTLKDMYDTKVSTLKRGYRPEAVERVSPAAPPAAEPEETRVINGVTYRKRGGEWVTDG